MREVEQQARQAGPVETRTAATPTSSSEAPTRMTEFRSSGSTSGFIETDADLDELEVMDLDPELVDRRPDSAPERPLRGVGRLREIGRRPARHGAGDRLLGGQLGGWPRVGVPRARHRPGYGDCRSTNTSTGTPSRVCARTPTGISWGGPGPARTARRTGAASQSDRHSRTTSPRRVTTIHCPAPTRRTHVASQQTTRTPAATRTKVIAVMTRVFGRVAARTEWGLPPISARRRGSLGTTRRARLSDVPLYWKVVLINGPCCALRPSRWCSSPVSVSRRAVVSEVVVLTVGLAVMLLANALLLRSSLAPLDRVVREMATGPAPPGRRAGSGPSSGLGRQLAGFNTLLGRIEAERSTSNAQALAAQEAERHRIAQELHDEVGQS